MNYHQKEEFQSMLIVCYQLTIHLRNFTQNGVSTIRNIWAVESKMKSCFDIRATTTEWINRFQKIMLEFMIAQMTEA